METMASEPISEDETKIFICVSEGNLDGLRLQFAELNCHVDIVDEHGMSLLSHAAFKGNKEICQYLLDQGADVNCDKHEHGYTALHFAVLSGNSHVCLLLLEAGAKSHHTNSVGRTPAQMAGFVGNQHCASIINNFVPKSDIEYYSVPHGTETNPKIPPKCVLALHKLIMQINIHPVRIALNLLPQLVKELQSVAKVLHLLSEKEMAKGSEIMSLKYHYLHCIVTEIMKYSSSEKQCSDPVELFVKKILRGNRGDEYLDSLIRETVREFPYREIPFFRQVVSGLVAMKGSVGSALTVLHSAINGENSTSEDNVCATCSDPNPPKRCSKCKEVRYCDRECQRLHWPSHKKECSRSVPSPDQITSNLESLST